jgi:hypothetical protein
MYDRTTSSKASTWPLKARVDLPFHPHTWLCDRTPRHVIVRCLR